MEMYVDGTDAVRKAYSCGIEDMDDLADVLGMVPSREFDRLAEESAPGIGKLLEGNRLGRELREAVAAGASSNQIKELRRKIIATSLSRIEEGLDLKDYGISCAVGVTIQSVVGNKNKEKEMETKKSTKAVRGTKVKTVPVAKVKKTVPVAKKLIEATAPCVDGSVAGDVMPKHVLGMTSRSFCGRECVAVRRVPGMFGAKGSAKERVVELTLVKGIVNPSELSSDGVPTPYWAVIDAASVLEKGFTRKDVVDMAADMIARHGGSGSREDIVKSCGTAWDVMKNHHNHPTKREAGLWYMVEEGDSKKVMLIRARREEETFQKFEAMRADSSNRVEAKKTKSVPKTVPTEERPVVSIVE